MSKIYEKILYRTSLDINLLELQKFVLSIIFFKFISNQITNFINEEYSELSMISQKKYLSNKIKDKCLDQLGFFIENEYCYHEIIKKYREPNYNAHDKLKESFQLIENSASKLKNNYFYNLFSDINLNFALLGNTKEKINNSLMNIIDLIETENSENLYQYFSDYIQNSSFFSEKVDNEPLIKLISNLTNNIDAFKIYDPFCNNAFLLFNVKKKHHENNVILAKCLKTELASFVKMFFIIQGYNYKNIIIRIEKKIEENNFPEFTNQIDLCVANFTYFNFLGDKTIKYGPNQEINILEQILHILNTDGTGIICVPYRFLHSNLSSYKIIRKKIIDKSKKLSCVIGIPSWINNFCFMSAILIFKKNKEDNIFFIDASKFNNKKIFKKEQKDEVISLITETYFEKKEIEKISKIVSLDEIKSNNYNLAIENYIIEDIDILDHEEENINDIEQKILFLETEIKTSEEKINKLIRELRKKYVR